MRRKRIAAFMALVLAVQMLPLPAGAMAGVLRIVSGSQAAGDMSGTDGNLSWQLTAETAKDGWDLKDKTPYKLTLTGTGAMKPHRQSAYKIDETHTVYITDAPWRWCYEQIQTISVGSGITDISSSAFDGCVSATSVEMPDSVTKIGNSAFSQCSNLKSAVLPGNVDTIGGSAFYGCADLASVNIPDKVTTIDSYTFRGCRSLKEIAIPADVTIIGDSAFTDCAKLETVTIPGKVKSIGSRAFYGCSQLGSVSIGGGTEEIGSDSFTNTSLTEFHVPASVERITSNPCVGGQLEKVTVDAANKNFQAVNNMIVEWKDGAPHRVVCYPYQGGAKAVVPNQVKEIGTYAFCQTQIESVDLPGSLLTIGDNAFLNAVKLAAVDVPGNVTGIGAYAFRNCQVLADVKLGGDVQSIGRNAFANCGQISQLVLPDKTKSIGDSAFSHCTKLKTLDFPNSIETIGGSVLSNCTALEKVSFGQEIQQILGNVFSACPKLADIAISPRNTHMVVENNVIYNRDRTKLIYYAAGQTDEKFLIPNTVKVVGSYAFNYAGTLKELKIPESVSSLEVTAICQNRNLGKLLFYGNAPAVAEYYSHSVDVKGNVVGCTGFNNSVRYNKSGMTVHRVDGSAGWENGWTQSKAHTQHLGLGSNYSWSPGYTVLGWDPSKTDVANGSFGDLTWDYRDDVGELTFFGSGKIPDFAKDNLEKWSNDPANVDHRNDIQLIETGPATEVGSNAFYGLANLVRIYSGEELERIGESAFADCRKLKIVQVESASAIEKEAFARDVAIVDELDVRGAANIGEGAFRGCTGMTDILLGEKLKTLGKEAFQGCIGLETLILPESLASLGEGCFRGCQALRTLNIPKGVSGIPAGCFADCAGFQKIYFYGDRPSTLDATAFAGTHADMTIYYRKGNGTWSSLGNDWNGIPVVGLDQFYTEGEDHYSFGNAGSSFGYGSQYYIPRQRYITALQSIVRGSYYYAWDKGWRGSCFGMAASTTEFYQGDAFELKDYGASAGNLYDLKAPGSSDAAITKLIEVYQVSQFVDEISWENSGNRGNYRKLVKQVEEFERSGGLSVDSMADPIVMCIYSKCAGHAVVPVAVNMDAHGNYILDVYDCNEPSGLQKLTVKKDFSGIEYVSGLNRYTSASFVKYSTISDALSNADFTGENFEKAVGAKNAAPESTKVSIAVNREKVSLVNGGGKDFEEIKGAYEQTRMANGADEFSGIRSFVLPQGEYKVQDASEAGSQQEELKYYIATEDLFSEIETSDEDAEVTVKSVKGVGYDTVTLSSDQSDTETELTVMDVSGIKKEVAVTGSGVSLEIVDDSQMTLSVSSDAASVKVDGEEVALSEGKAKVSFYASEGENPMEAGDMTCQFSLDENDRLSGTAEAYITWKNEDAQDVDVTTKVKDEEGNVIAEYEKKMNLRLGMQKVNVTLDRVKTNLSHLSGDFKASCEMTLVDANANVVRVTYSDIPLKATDKTPEHSKEPTAEPSAAPTTEPTDTPSAAPAETATPAPTAEPTKTPGVTQEPPAQTEKPKATKKPKAKLPKKGAVKTVGSLKYVVMKSAKKNGTVAVCGVKKKNAKSVVIPGKVKIGKYSFKVVSVRRNAFSKNKKLAMVTVGANVKSIGDNAFKNCKKLEFVLLPGKVASIGKKAFAGCGRLRYLVVRTNKIKSVGTSAFQGVSGKMKVKTSRGRWRKYSKIFTKKGKMPRTVLYLIEPVKVKYRGKSY